MQARSQRTLAAILQAAAQILVKEGEGALTTNRIAERAGVSIGTLYQYFPDKQAIFRAMVDGQRREAIAAIEAWLEKASEQGLEREAVARGVIVRIVDGFAGRTPARRKLARFAWRQDGDERIALSMRETAERMAAHLQRWGGPSLSHARLYVATRAVLGTVRFASLEASPLIASGVLEELLCEMGTAMLMPAGAGQDGSTP
ncbi:division inhibitor protein [Delftia tsuruhatensis]|uniref:TetR/AcrR family transcriptional regulator n=1 Tax=Delftia tsuruhatensis TaxID=180282 RepID=UPI001E77E768|nr:TetR/AcrR family transcriptional regulator [Delftia tsuruhatensis]CAB5713322.1 division inhibitor protein [Delftia tsuruhatensis]CAC9691993.1 division inhibitor protein [Delftia tsuruhatensis]